MKNRGVLAFACALLILIIGGIFVQQRVAARRQEEARAKVEEARAQAAMVRNLEQDRARAEQAAATAQARSQAAEAALLQAQRQTIQARTQSQAATHTIVPPSPPPYRAPFAAVPTTPQGYATPYPSQPYQAPPPPPPLPPSVDARISALERSQAQEDTRRELAAWRLQQEREKRRLRDRMERGALGGGPVDPNASSHTRYKLK